MERIVSLETQIRKFYFEKHLDFMTSVPQRRTQEIIVASCAKENSGKMTDYAEIFPTHGTTYGHFLSKGKWDDEKVVQIISLCAFLWYQSFSNRIKCDRRCR